MGTEIGPINRFRNLDSKFIYQMSLSVCACGNLNNVFTCEMAQMHDPNCQR